MLLCHRVFLDVKTSDQKYKEKDLLLILENYQIITHFSKYILNRSKNQGKFKWIECFTGMRQTKVFA